MAVLEVTSVRKMITTTTPIIASTGKEPNAPRLWAIHSARPVLRITPARDRPPPNSSSTPQGSLTALSQFIRNTRCLASTGMMNSAMAAAMAMLVSLTPGICLGDQRLQHPGRCRRHEDQGHQFLAAAQGPMSASSLRIKRPAL